ncbi:MAG: translation initiation factor eIF-1A [Candidatus Aenigmarchaeota archaeon]|nr:translation initiation factor eIF-1A [Candidatus Aenigmarchaeota archaeon]
MEIKVGKIRIPKGNEVFGLVEAMLGAGRSRVRCQDNKIRICRVPGRLRRKMWIKENCIVIVEPWKIQGDSRGDIIWKYTNAQIASLRRKKLLNL